MRGGILNVFGNLKLEGVRGCPLSLLKNDGLIGPGAKSGILVFWAGGRVQNCRFQLEIINFCFKKADFRFKIAGFRLKMTDFSFKIADFGSKRANFSFKMVGFSFKMVQMVDFSFKMSDFSSKIANFYFKMGTVSFKSVNFSCKWSLLGFKVGPKGPNRPPQGPRAILGHGNPLAPWKASKMFAWKVSCNRSRQKEASS